MNNTMYHLFFRRLGGGVRKYLPALLVVAAFTACQKTGFTYNNIVENNQTDYILSDTLSVRMKTIQRDSVPTSYAGVLLAGSKTDPLFGKITASSFFQIAQPASIDIPAFGSKYDSMALIMHPNGYMSGDSTVPQSFQVYRVTSTIQTALNFYYLYSNSNFSTESTPIGNFSGIIRPRTDKVISVSMSDVLGNQLFTMLRDKSPDIIANNTFLEFFKGLNVRGGPNSPAVTGFIARDTSLVMRLYYHTNEIITTVKYVDFKMQAPNLQFNRVLADRTGTPIETLKGTVKELPTENSGNVAFMQPITGAATRIDIPYIKNLAFLGQFFKIMKVYMTIKPISGTYTDNPLPARLALCELDNNNNVTDTLSYGQLTVDNLYNARTNYTYDITNYCIKQQTVTDYYSRGLLLTPSNTDGKTTLDRLVIGDQKNAKNKITIQLYYLLYK
ncbi:uncharacterized protein DUF4270 [Chitinophaga niastensis]|uniref:Uncharacterized protein DUF4270 n=1 Tax=Chitinophaga niastensis TaxID=536980 RepID=A0A2P8HMY4_CHINA|nr:DUF4270 family protein [Chitinophaga niastensis]PSL47582.1 uncharacterized protein DUF4270 [Chitinophaga niastensis]